MEKIPLSRSADICDYTLTRRIIHALGCGANRDGDNLTVYSIPSRTGRGLYVRDTEDCERISTLYIDEGFQPDTLREDGTVGPNHAWAEYCGMNTILQLIISKIDPDVKYKPSPFIGGGRTARHYHEQYIEALERLLPDSELSDKFAWIEGEA